MSASDLIRSFNGAVRAIERNASCYDVTTSCSRWEWMTQAFSWFSTRLLLATWSPPMTTTTMNNYSNIAATTAQQQQQGGCPADHKPTRIDPSLRDRGKPGRQQRRYAEAGIVDEVALAHLQALSWAGR